MECISSIRESNQSDQHDDALCLRAVEARALETQKAGRKRRSLPHILWSIERAWLFTNGHILDTHVLHPRSFSLKHTNWSQIQTSDKISECWCHSYVHIDQYREIVARATTRAFIDQLCKQLDGQLCGHLHEQLAEQQMRQVQYLSGYSSNYWSSFTRNHAGYYTSIHRRKQLRELALDFAAHPHEPKEFLNQRGPNALSWWRTWPLYYVQAVPASCRFIASPMFNQNLNFCFFVWDAGKVKRSHRLVCAAFDVSILRSNKFLIC